MSLTLTYNLGLHRAADRSQLYEIQFFSNFFLKHQNKQTKKITHQTKTKKYKIYPCLSIEESRSSLSG